MKRKKITKKRERAGAGSLTGGRKIGLGRHWSYNLHNDPKRLAFVLSRYKFSARMAGHNKRILELGCGEGIGTTLLAEFAESYTGVDSDKDAVRAAKRNWTAGKISFIEDDFLAKTYGVFDVIVSLDVVEHILPASERLFFEAVRKNTGKEGMAIIGTPNITSADHASSASRAGHVNLFGAKRLEGAMKKYFRNVFIFGMNDELMHTGFYPMAHYLIAIGSGEKI